MRFIQLYHRGWDHHGNLKKDMTTASRLVDQGSAAQIKDLKQRGMLEDTLVVWGGEFGRTPMRENRGGQEMKFVGRDHNPGAFTVWMAGGGVKPGISYGATDELGWKAAEHPTYSYDFHATALHLLGIDHERLSFYHNGIERRLTDVHGEVVRGILRS